MGKVIGTCGHEVSIDEDCIPIPDSRWDYEMDRFVDCISYGVYCPECKKFLALEIRKGRKMEREWNL